MVMIDETYKGYRIKWGRGGQLFANIWPPNSGLALAGYPQATREEGEAVLRQRAYAMIDADIADHAGLQKA